MSNAPKARRRTKVWIKVPPGHDFADPPSVGGVEHFQVSPVEPPICCGETPPLADAEDPEGERVCKPCGSRWYP